MESINKTDKPPAKLIKDKRERAKTNKITNERGEITTSTRKISKGHNTWRLKNILLKNEWINQEIKEEIKKYMEVKENENTTVKTLWDAAKAILRVK